jgi:hypothetical protein
MLQISFYTHDDKQEMRKNAGENRGAYRLVLPPNITAP